MQDFIRIRGARVHNLKNISLSIPHNQLTVITGVSGSGKSSLAFDTIYAEGQRRYVESLSAYARQFLERMEKPDVDEIDGIAPAVAIRQKNTTRNPRSTVATSTECYDFLRLLFARVGQTFCPNCGTRVRKDTVDEVAARLLDAARGLALVRAVSRAASTPDRRRCAIISSNCARRASTGCFRTAALFEFSTPESLLDIDFAQAAVRAGGPHRDRPGPAPAPGRHHRDLLPRGGRSDFRERRRRAERLRFNEKFECKTCGMEFATPEPILFSFNSPAGRVPALPGLRQHHRFRHGPRDPRQDAVARRGRGGSVDQAASTARGWAISRSTRKARCASTCRSAT